MEHHRSQSTVLVDVNSRRIYASRRKCEHGEQSRKSMTRLHWADIPTCPVEVLDHRKLVRASRHGFLQCSSHSPNIRRRDCGHSAHRRLKTSLPEEHEREGSPRRPIEAHRNEIAGRPYIVLRVGGKREQLVAGIRGLVCFPVARLIAEEPRFPPSMTGPGFQPGMTKLLPIRLRQRQNERDTLSARSSHSL
jgi:hypothetical protein